MSCLEIVSWSLLCFIVCLRGALSVLFALGDHMRKEKAEINEMPGLTPIYARHFLHLVTKARAFGPRHRVKKITLTVKPGVRG